MMSRILITLAAVAVLVYLACCILLFAFQRSLIYFPQPPSTAAGATEFVLPRPDATVSVTLRVMAGPDAVIYFGGNAEDVNHSLSDLASAYPAHALYLMQYRGYGNSSGQPSEAALIADALALFDKVHAEHPRVVLVGRSLGSGVAVHVASERQVARLVLVTPYYSLQDLAVAQFPYFPVRWLLRDKFESWKYAQQVTTPTLLIAAERDEVIPRASTDLLLGRFLPGVAKLSVVADVGHNTIAQRPEYLSFLRGAP